MRELQYYKAVLSVEYEDAKGKIKKRREEYIVEGISPTDIEAKIHKRMQGSTEDFSISSISITNILEVIK